jgi:hypothetical protein
MILKFFDDFDGIWKDVSGNTGSTLQKGADGWETSAGFQKVVLLLSQSGTDAPEYTELENTTGQTYTFARDISAGNYTMSFSSGVLSQGKTIIFIQQSDVDVIQAYRYDATQINIVTSGDDILFFTSLEIRLYN